MKPYFAYKSVKLLAKLKELGGTQELYHNAGITDKIIFQL